jgi:hypothetical protein
MMKAMRDKKPDLVLMGIGLHAFQDSYSHSGFGEFFGHSLAGEWDISDWGHDPDRPYKDPAKALRMAEATYDALKAFKDKFYPDAKTKKTWREIKPSAEKIFGLVEKSEITRGMEWDQLYRDTFPDRGYIPELANFGDKSEWRDEFLAAAGRVGLPYDESPPRRKGGRARTRLL